MINYILFATICFYVIGQDKGYEAFMSSCMCDKFENVVSWMMLLKWSFLEPDTEQMIMYLLVYLGCLTVVKICFTYVCLF